jgi:hypothetical protein
MSLINHLNAAEHLDLSGENITDITDGACIPMAYSFLSKVLHIDQLFERGNAALAILYQTTDSTTGHWVGLIKHSSDHLEFFDPYAFKPDEELAYSPFDKRLIDDKAIPHLEHLLNESGYKITWNKVRLQQELTDVNTCGRHVATRVKFRDLPLKQYQTMLTSNKFGNPDMWVTSLTIMNSL